jgi:putative tryptophan/tyrosine transport system substrate-binding protein
MTIKASLSALPLRLILPVCFFFLLIFNHPLMAEQWRLAIVQSIKHPALDDVASGVKQYFHESEIYPDFMLIVADYGSDNNETPSAAIKKIADFDPDLIVTIGTQASQEISGRIDSVPIIFTAVTDPVGAGLVESMSHSGGKRTGLTDMSPVEAHLDIIIRIQPEIKNLGMVFSQFEQNAAVIKDHLNTVAKNFGVSLIGAPVERGEKVTDRALGILDSIDALYISTDNYVVSSVRDLARLCASAGIPLYAADPSSVAGGAMVALSIDYFQMGLQTGAMSRRVLEGADPALMPVERPREMTITINTSAAGVMGIDLPMDLIMAADMIYSSFPDEHP